MSRGLAHNFRCGDRVYDKVDPRHVGEIRLINSGIFAIVKWETDWDSERYSEVLLRDLVKAPASMVD